MEAEGQGIFEIGELDHFDSCSLFFPDETTSRQGSLLPSRAQGGGRVCRHQVRGGGGPQPQGRPPERGGAHSKRGDRGQGGSQVCGLQSAPASSEWSLCSERRRPRV